MKTEILLLIYVLMFGINCLGQSRNNEQYFTIENITSETGTYSIPLVKSSLNPESADKINQIIQMTTVRKSYNVDKEAIFSDLLNDNGYGTVSLGFNILLNNGSILSIHFNDETMSSYPDYHSFYLNFNSSTGDIVDINELLNRVGIDHINDIASSTFNKKIKQNHLEIIEDSTLELEQRNEFFDYIFDLTECNAKYSIWKYGFTKESILVEKDRCFPHVIQAFDINWSSTIQIKDLFSSDYTVYGKNLLKQSLPDKSKHYDQKKSVMTLHGKIDDKYPFAMYLRLNDDNSIGGYYWYNKFGDLVNFSGKRLSEKQIELTEDGGKFILSINDSGEISGAWENKLGKSMPIKFY